MFFNIFYKLFFDYTYQKIYLFDFFKQLNLIRTSRDFFYLNDIIFETVIKIIF